MNGKLYSTNLSTLANNDGAGTSPAMTENMILWLWANALTSENHAGKIDYRLWLVILEAKGGPNLNGSMLQRIVWSLANIITGETLDSGWNIYELIAAAASDVGPPPVEPCFTLIGQAECFTLIGSADPFELIP